MKVISFPFSIVGVCLLFSFVKTSFAQNSPPFVILMEESTTGKYMDTIPTSGPAIVDINSMIHIKIEYQF